MMNNTTGFLNLLRKDHKHERKLLQNLNFIWLGLQTWLVSNNLYIMPRVRFRNTTGAGWTMN